MKETYPFNLPKLQYSYDSLEPYIDKTTITLHHNEHFKKYVHNLNRTLFKYPMYQNLTLLQLLQNCSYFPKELMVSVKQNAGGIYNHALYFNCMGNTDIKDPFGNLLLAILNKFSTLENFYEVFKQNALSIFGSGYTFLILNNFNKLEIVSVANQDLPYTLNLTPLLVIDLWEHSYYLKYMNKKDEYIDNFFKVVDWALIEKQYIYYTTNIC